MNIELFREFYDFTVKMNSNIGKMNYAIQNNKQSLISLNQILRTIKLNGITDRNRNEYVNVKKYIQDYQDEIDDLEVKIEKLKEPLACVHLKIDEFINNELKTFINELRPNRRLDDCPVCLNNIICETGIFNCNHHICSGCYVRLSNRICPLCRADQISR